MPTPSYVSPFTGTVVTPTDVTYNYVTVGNENIQFYWPSVAVADQLALPRILEVYNNSGGTGAIYLPQGNQGTLGADVLIVNLGATDAIVRNFDFSLNWVIPPGISQYFWLNGNDNEGGLWESVTFGAGTSAAQASQLIGYGITALGSQLWTIVEAELGNLNIPPTLDNFSNASILNWVGGNNTVTLPPFADLNYGWYFYLRNSGTGNLVIQPQGTTTINNAPNISLTPGDSCIVIKVYATNNFVTIGNQPQTAANFSSSVYDVDSIVGNTLSLASFAPIIQNYVALSGTRTANLNVELPAITQLYIVANNTNNPLYYISFTIAGSLSAPLILQAGQVAVVLSDGVNLLVLNQTSIGYFVAADGFQTNPTFTFYNDPTSGMYLSSPGILGLTAAGSNILTMDGTVSGSEVVSTTAEFKAKLISGGSF